MVVEKFAMRKRRVGSVWRMTREAGVPGCFRVQVVRFRATILEGAIPLHFPSSGCTSLSGGKRQYHLCEPFSASAPRISFAAVPVRSRGALRPVLPRGRRVIHKRGETRPFRPSSRATASVHASNRRIAAALSESQCARRAGDVSPLFQSDLLSACGAQPHRSPSVGGASTQRCAAP